MIRNQFKLIMVKMFVSLAYLIHLLITSFCGILVCSIFLYYFSTSLGLDQPYNFPELMLWLDQLPENSKTTVFTSIITISGFLVVFSINSASQKQQLMSQMRLEASNDIEAFFNEASRDITSANIYAKYLIRIVNHINNRADEDTIKFHLQNVIKETEKYVLLRKKLQKQAIEVHRFQGKYTVIFASSWGVTHKLETAVEAFSKITKEIWFSTPILCVDDLNVKEKYLAQVNIEQCNNYINTYGKYYDVINESTGGLRGSMVGTITGLNFSLVINLLKMKKG